MIVAPTVNAIACVDTLETLKEPIHWEFGLGARDVTVGRRECVREPWAEMCVARGWRSAGTQGSQSVAR